MSEARKRWRLIDLLQWTSEHLDKKGFDSPRLTAERLLAHVLRLQRVDLYLQFDRLLTGRELQEFKSLLQRRLRHEPLQYILGETEFFGRRFKVTPAVLIPRPETEILVEETLRHVARLFQAEQPIQILDVGTGSGNIAVTLAAELPAAVLTALDVSAAALAVAQENALDHEVKERLEFIEAAFVDFARQAVAAGIRFDVLVSNPPYVADTDLETLAPEVRDYEPRAALVAEGDVLGHFRELATWGPRLLRSPGLLAVEVGLGQAETVRQLFQEQGFSAVRVRPDLSGIDRVITAVLRNDHTQENSDVAEIKQTTETTPV